MPATAFQTLGQKRVSPPHRPGADPAVARAALEESGLDGARLLELTQDPAVKDRLLQNTQGSVERGTFGSPTFFVGDEIFFGKDRLRDVEEEIVGARAT
jgi:2-hydroxychromene-2-carboxylate isomerase